jgi:hypothetical protein
MTFSAAARARPQDRRPRILPSSDRAVEFSDAIFAITITLLALEIRRPSFRGPDLVGRLLDDWSQYAGFVMSFMHIGSLWINHYAVFARVRRVDPALNWINLAILGKRRSCHLRRACCRRVRTRSSHENRAAAVVVYAVVSCFMAASWIPLFRYLGRHPELLEDPDRRTALAGGAAPGRWNDRLRDRRTARVVRHAVPRRRVFRAAHRVPRHHQRGTPRKPPRAGPARPLIADGVSPSRQAQQRCARASRRRTAPCTRFAEGDNPCMRLLALRGC